MMAINTRAIEQLFDLVKTLQNKVTQLEAEVEALKNK